MSTMVYRNGQRPIVFFVAACSLSGSFYLKKTESEAKPVNCTGTNLKTQLALDATQCRFGHRAVLGPHRHLHDASDPERRSGAGAGMCHRGPHPLACACCCRQGFVSECCHCTHVSPFPHVPCARACRSWAFGRSRRSLTKMSGRRGK